MIYTTNVRGSNGISFVIFSTFGFVLNRHFSVLILARISHILLRASDTFRFRLVIRSVEPQDHRVLVRIFSKEYNTLVIRVR